MMGQDRQWNVMYKNEKKERAKRANYWFSLNMQIYDILATFVVVMSNLRIITSFHGYLIARIFFCSR